MIACQVNVMEIKNNANNDSQDENEPILSTVVSEFYEFDCEAITDPVELEKLRLPVSPDRSTPILIDEVDEFIESSGNAITDATELARLRPQVDRARRAG